MEKAKLAVAFVLLTVFSVSAVWAEYTLMMRFGITFSVATVSGLSVLLIALLRAPEGYEDETGFHIGTLADAALRESIAFCAPAYSVLALRAIEPAPF